MEELLPHMLCAVYKLTELSKQNVAMTELRF